MRHHSFQNITVRTLYSMAKEIFVPPAYIGDRQIVFILTNTQFRQQARLEQEKKTENIPYHE